MIALDLGNKTGIAWTMDGREYAEEIKLPVGKMPMMERATLLINEIRRIHPDLRSSYGMKPCTILIEDVNIFYVKSKVNIQGKDVNIFRGKANMQGLVKLCGFVAGYFKAQGHHVELVHPRTWMGNKKRTVKSNKADALGLLNWGLTRNQVGNSVIGST